MSHFNLENSNVLVTDLILGRNVGTAAAAQIKLNFSALQARKLPVPLGVTLTKLWRSKSLHFHCKSGCPELCSPQRKGGEIIQKFPCRTRG